MYKDIHHAAPVPQVMATLYFGANIPAWLYECPNCKYRRHAPYKGECGDCNSQVEYAPVIETVTDDKFARFIKDSIAPRFPGFTLVTAQGYWKGEPETVRVVTVLGEDDSSFRTNIRIIAEHYKSDFGQEAVAYSFNATEYTLNCWPYGPVGAYHKPGLGY